MAWDTVEIGSFLKERGDRYKPEEANTLDLKRIKKIDFQGKIHVIDHKPTKTNMILVKKGDLVISGINVEKGALAVYEEDEDALATIHYSSYVYDENQVDIEYLKWFLKSRTFQDIVKEQVGGGIKTELKPKKFLPLKITLPGLDEQIDIANRINNVTAEINELSETNNHNQTLLIQLRQAILQEAVQGKLAPQDPNDEPASELLKRIKAEKEKLITEGKNKKQKTLPPITENEIPYDLSQGWEWVRFTDVAYIASNLVNPLDHSDMPHIAPNNIEKNTGKLLYHNTVREDDVRSPNHFFISGQILYSKIRPNLSKVIIANFNSKYLLIYMLSNVFLDMAVKKDNRVAMPKINQTELKLIPVPVPSLTEQKRIVAKVDHLMHLCDELEARLNQSKKDSEMLMQAVLHEAFF
jgi:restriction endonuclease S subunit